MKKKKLEEVVVAPKRLMKKRPFKEATKYKVEEAGIRVSFPTIPADKIHTVKLVHVKNSMFNRGRFRYIRVENKSTAEKPKQRPNISKPTVERPQSQYYSPANDWHREMLQGHYEKKKKEEGEDIFEKELKDVKRKKKGIIIKKGRKKQRSSLFWFQ